MNIRQTGATVSPNLRPSPSATQTEQQSQSPDCVTPSAPNERGLNDVLAYVALGAASGAAGGYAGTKVGGLAGQALNAVTVAALDTTGASAEILMGKSNSLGTTHMTIGPKAGAAVLVGTFIGGQIISGLTGASPTLGGAIAGGLSHGIAAALTNL